MPLIKMAMLFTSGYLFSSIFFVIIDNLIQLKKGEAVLADFKIEKSNSYRSSKYIIGFKTDFQLVLIETRA
jgi:hypothetical protein